MVKRFVMFAALALFALAAPTVHARPRTLADMIEAGHYDWVDPLFVEQNFPVKPERFVTAGLSTIRINKRTRTEDVLAEIDRKGFRPATIEGLLAYGAKRLKAKPVEIIVALGSTWRAPSGNHRVAAIRIDVGLRGLYRAWAGPGDWWPPHSRFLVMRK